MANLAAEAGGLRAQGGRRRALVAASGIVDPSRIAQPPSVTDQFGGRAAFTMAGGSLYSFTFNTTANYFSSLSGVFNETIQSVRPAAKAAKRPGTEPNVMTREEKAEAILKMARTGDVEAQRLLGKMYVAGEGVPQDNSEAFKWYKAAAEQDDAEDDRDDRVDVGEQRRPDGSDLADQGEEAALLRGRQFQASRAATARAGGRAVRRRAAIAARRLERFGDSRRAHRTGRGIR